MRRLLFSLLMFIAASVQAQSFETTVSPQPGEDIAQDCHYQMLLPNGDAGARGLWVIYDRGPQITSFYSDPIVVAFAKRHDLGLLLAHQCNGTDAPGGPEEMDMDPTKGIGRALLTAIQQLGRLSGHPELTEAKLILLGFSGTGALFAHFGEYAPRRVIAAVLIHPAHYAPAALNRVQLSGEGRQIPELIFAGGADTVATTQSPYDYFERYRKQGAPWTFLVQNATGHFGVSITKDMVMAWLDAVLAQRDPAPGLPLKTIDETGSWVGYIQRCSSADLTSRTWNVCDAALVKKDARVPEKMIEAGWLPSANVAELWLQAEQSLKR